jgi:hypothetical protein
MSLLIRTSRTVPCFHLAVPIMVLDTDTSVQTSLFKSSYRYSRRRRYQWNLGDGICDAITSLQTFELTGLDRTVLHELLSILTSSIWATRSPSWASGLIHPKIRRQTPQSYIEQRKWGEIFSIPPLLGLVLKRTCDAPVVHFLLEKLPRCRLPLLL